MMRELKGVFRMDEKEMGPEKDKDERKDQGGCWCGGCMKSDRLDSAGWGAIFIWGALILLAESMNYAANFSWWDGWALFFAGVGTIVLVGAYVRIRVPEYRKPVVSSIIFGLFMLAIGLDGLGWSLAWPAALGAIGIVILLSVWRGSK